MDKIEVKVNAVINRLFKSEKIKEITTYTQGYEVITFGTILTFIQNENLTDEDCEVIEETIITNMTKRGYEFKINENGCLDDSIFVKEFEDDEEE